MCHEHTPAAVSGKTKGIQSITATTGSWSSDDNKITVLLPALRRSVTCQFAGRQIQTGKLQPAYHSEYPACNKSR